MNENSRIFSRVKGLARIAAVRTTDAESTAVGDSVGDAEPNQLFAGFIFNAFQDFVRCADTALVPCVITALPTNCTSISNGINRESEGGARSSATITDCPECKSVTETYNNEPTSGLNKLCKQRGATFAESKASSTEENRKVQMKTTYNESAIDRRIGKSCSSIVQRKFQAGVFAADAKSNLNDFTETNSDNNAVETVTTGMEADMRKVNAPPLIPISVAGQAVEKSMQTQMLKSTARILLTAHTNCADQLN